jgi:alpha,alpha-trehalase
MEQYLWHEESGTFRDYDFVNQTHSSTACLATYHALWAGWCSPEKAFASSRSFAAVEFPFGIAVCAPQTRAETYQWDYPNGWPPLFWTTISGLNSYGFAEDAQRIAQKYVDLCLTNFAHNGQLWEKFDVTTGEVAGGEYDAQPMLGWSAGVFLACCELLQK